MHDHCLNVESYKKTTDLKYKYKPQNKKILLDLYILNYYC